MEKDSFKKEINLKLNMYGILERNVHTNVFPKIELKNKFNPYKYFLDTYLSNDSKYKPNPFVEQNPDRFFLKPNKHNGRYNDFSLILYEKQLVNEDNSVVRRELDLRGVDLTGPYGYEKVFRNAVQDVLSVLAKELEPIRVFKNLKTPAAEIVEHILRDHMLILTIYGIPAYDIELLAVKRHVLGEAVNGSELIAGLMEKLDEETGVEVRMQFIKILKYIEMLRVGEVDWQKLEVDPQRIEFNLKRDIKPYSRGVLEALGLNVAHIQLRAQEAAELRSNFEEVVIV